MGSPCEIVLGGLEPRAAAALAAEVERDVARLETRYSRYRAESLLSRINAVAATGGAIDVDAETASLLDYAATCHRQSDGLFDITSGILRAAWRFERGDLPSQARIDDLLRQVGWHHVRWHNPRLSFDRPGMELDFGGIVKEYAVDRAAAICVERGLRHGVVNLGGDLRAIGVRPDGDPWRVDVAHPRRAGAALGRLHLQNGALATSGDYERCIVIDGVRYSHVLNPHTGWPVRHLASVTVAAGLCVVAGSAATIAMLKEEDGPAWLQALGVPHLWVDVQGRSGGTLHLDAH